MSRRSKRVASDESTEAAYSRVETPVSCILTRFRLRSAFALPRFYRAYRRIKADASKVDGLVASLFVIEDLRTCYTLSIWRNPRAIIKFNSSVPAHIHAANRCFRDLVMGPDGPQLWSAEFRLWAVSPNNLRWDGLELEDGAGESRSESGRTHA
jgi:hypothetical protein